MPMHSCQSHFYVKSLNLHKIVYCREVEVYKTVCAVIHVDHLFILPHFSHPCAGKLHCPTPVYSAADGGSGYSMLGC